MAGKRFIVCDQCPLPALARQLLLLTCLMLHFGSSSLFAGTLNVFGPENFLRGSGAPTPVTRHFTVSQPNVTYTLRIINGGLIDGEFEKVSSSVVILNGLQIVGPKALNQNVALVEKSVVLAAANELKVELRGKPGGMVTIEIVGVSGITITSPTSASALNAATILVRGVVDVPVGTEHGVTVNDIVAEVNNDEFAAVIPLELGTNVITAKLFDARTTVAIATVTVNVLSLPEEPFQLLVSPSQGVTPLIVQLRPSSLLQRPIVRSAFDFEGDGIVDLSLATSDGMPYAYTAEQLFFPTLTVTDDAGNTHSATAIVNVFRMPNLVAKWSAMKDALRQGNVEAALGFIAQGARERYRAIFTALGAELANIDAILTDIQLVAVRRTEAEFAMLRTGADGVERSYYIVFIRDADGIWRLSTF